MALIGNCIFTEYVDSGETETITITHPDGSTEEREEPIMNPVDNEYNDIYLIVKQVEFFQVYTNNEGEEVENNSSKVQAVIFHIAGYESREARDADQENWLFWDTMQLDNYDYDLNVYQQCYNKIKETRGFTNLIND